LTYAFAALRKSKAAGDTITLPRTYYTKSWFGDSIEIDGGLSLTELFETSLATWNQAIGQDQIVNIELVVTDFDSAQLADTQILEYDRRGIPTRARIRIDDDGAGVGWSGRTEGDPAQDEYDLFTVLLHEVGHAIGFTPTFNGFSNLLTNDDAGNVVIVGDGFSATLDSSSQHLDPAAHPDDLLNATLDPGSRKLPSELDVQIIQAALTSAIDNPGLLGGFSAIYGTGSQVSIKVDVNADGDNGDAVADPQGYSSPTASSHSSVSLQKAMSTLLRNGLSVSAGTDQSGQVGSGQIGNTGDMFFENYASSNNSLLDRYKTEFELLAEEDGTADEAFDAVFALDDPFSMMG